MVPAPRYTKAVEVQNKSGGSVSVTAHYTNNQNNTTEQVTADILAGATHVFPEKTVDMGGWTAVCPISSVSTAGGHKLDISTDGVVASVQVHVQEAGTLHQTTRG